MKEIKVLICSPRQNVTEHFCDILTSRDIKVMGSVKNYIEAEVLIKNTKPDIVLTDSLRKNSYDGISITETILKNYPFIKCVLLTDNLDNERAADAYCAGAKEYFLLDTDENDVRNGIRNIFENDNYLGRIMDGKLRSEIDKIRRYRERLVFLAAKLNKLTKTELSILHMIVMGQKQKDIAEIRKTEVGTVKFHVHNILKKMDFKNTGEITDAFKETELFGLLKLMRTVDKKGSSIH